MSAITRLDIAALGDSHVDMFSSVCRVICKVPGASAYGTSNEKSKTHAREVFSGFLVGIREFQPLICIGEVDCNSVYWRGSIDKNTYVVTAITRLFNFIRNHYRKFIISSVVLPPVESYKNSKFRPHVSASREERSALVYKFNDHLKAASWHNGHYFLDITTPTVGDDGLISRKFFRPNNTHLNVTAIRPIIEEKIWEAKDFITENME